jgi:hypothetical protein
MATIAIDTHKVITRLQERGFTKDQAEALVAVAQEVDVSALPTKADLKDLELRLYKFFGGILVARGLGTAALTVALIEVLK